MNPSFVIEYACTDAEMREAQSLSIRQEIGGGSKARTHLILFAMLAGSVLLFYLFFRYQVSPQHRPWVMAGTACLFVYFFYQQRRARKRPRALARMELSAHGVRLMGDDASVAMPWSAFSDCQESSKLFVLTDRPKSVLYVLPKRAFPNEEAITWFREQSGNVGVEQTTSERETPSPAPVNPANSVALSFQLGYRDYLQLARASGRTGAMLLGLVLLFGGMTVYAHLTMQGPREISMLAVFFFFELPVIALFAPLMILYEAYNNWRSHKGYLGPQKLVLSDAMIQFEEQTGSGNMPWTTYRYFKETKSCFIIWNPQGRLWLLLPKRAFNSPADLERCRSFMKSQLRDSRWLFSV